MISTPIPSQAKIVIAGGGIIGCSVAYHLTKLGITDVVLLEQGRLSGGTTWHAAGLVGQLRAQENMTRLIQYSTRLYESLEAETGQATGWKRTGSVIVASTQDRLTVLKRTAAVAKAYGIDADMITPGEIRDIWPAMHAEDLVGGVWLPGDGKANPADITQALAKGARSKGATIIENTRITDVVVEDGSVVGVETPNGRITCEIFVNCAGQWARQLGRKSGVTVPLYSAEHMYIVTKPMAGIAPDLPVVRDPDGYIYFKEEVGGLVMGGFEPEAKPWGMDGIPDDFEFTLLPDDWDQFEILMENALHRVPALAKAEIRQFVNGPESFTPDSNYILGEAPEVRNYFVAAGFNSMGIASAGGAGKALAEWICEGDPTQDLWPVDIRRFAPFFGNDKWLCARVSETLGTHYQMPWPNREMQTARPFRRSPLYHILERKGACFGSKMGWERPIFFAGAGNEPKLDYGFGRQNWFDNRAREHLATRQAVAIFDQTSFSKFMIEGNDAEDVLQILCANNIAVEPGRCVYTGMLNHRGGYESDVTVTRLAEDRFLMVSGSAQTTRDMWWIRRNIPDHSHVMATDVTSAYIVLGVMGPKSRQLLSGLTDAALDNETFPFSTMREISLGYATVLAVRMTYVGELGWELYIPAEFAVGVYDEICKQGTDLGLVDAGYYAVDSLRIEKGYRAWGHELTPDYTPFHAGLSFAVDFKKPVDFLGRAALLEQQDTQLTKRLLMFTLKDPEPVIWGGELIRLNGDPVGKIESGSYGHTVGAAIGMGYVHHPDGIDDSIINSGDFALEIAGERYAADAHLRTRYDPSLQRPKS